MIKFMLTSAVVLSTLLTNANVAFAGQSCEKTAQKIAQAARKASGAVLQTRTSVLGKSSFRDRAGNVYVTYKVGFQATQGARIYIFPYDVTMTSTCLLAELKTYSAPQR